MDEFNLRSQIVTLVYDIFEKHPEKFAKLDDDTVTLMFDISSKLDLSSKVKGRLLEIRIVRKNDEKSTQYNYTLHILAGGDIYFKYEVAELDAKTAYRFFEAEHMLEKHEIDFNLVRDILLTAKGAE